LQPRVSPSGQSPVVDGVRRCRADEAGASPNRKSKFARDAHTSLELCASPTHLDFLTEGLRAARLPPTCGLWPTTRRRASGRDLIAEKSAQLSGWWLSATRFPSGSRT